MAVCVLLVLALLPSRYSGWTNWFGNVADFIIAPVQWPLNLVVGVFKRSGEAAVSMEYSRTRRSDSGTALWVPR